MKLSHFLRRINCAGPTAPREENLSALHRAFAWAVPFENLDIHMGRRIVLDEQALYEKVVQQHRGGLRYELNDFFAAALREFGFDVSYLSARMIDHNKGDGDLFQL